MPSTPSSASEPDHRPYGRPSRAAIALLVFLSLAIPGGALAVILGRDTRHSGGSSAGTPTTDVAPTDSSKAEVGSPAPDFTLRSTSGATVSLSAFRGYPVVVAFFASWCHPCEEELPVLEQFSRVGGTRLRVIGVSFQDLNSDSVAFVKRLHITFPALLDDPDGPVGTRYGVRGLPQTVFIDPRGVVRGRVFGQTSHRALQPAIDDLLHGRNIRPV